MNSACRPLISPTMRRCKHFTVLYYYTADHRMRALVLGGTHTCLVDGHPHETIILKVRPMRRENLEFLDEGANHSLFGLDVFDVPFLRFFIGLPGFAQRNRKMLRVSGMLAESCLDDC